MQLHSSDASEIGRIGSFRRGYSYFLNQFISLALGFQNYLSSGAIAESLKREMIPIRKELDTCLSQSIQSARDLLLELDEKHLNPAARKELITYFPDGNTDQHRLEFVMFYKTFEGLRKFYSISLVSWKQIQSLVLSASLSDEKFRSEILLRSRILPILDEFDNLKVFLQRMAVILEVENPDSVLQSKKISPNYNPNREYKLSSVFQEGLRRQAYSEEILPSLDLSDIKIEPTMEKSSEEEKVTFRSVPPKNQIHVLNTAGKLPWNSNSHYFFRYDPEKLEEERSLFRSVINMDTHLGAEENALRKEIIRSVTSKQIKSKLPDEFEGEYMIFLDQFFEFCRSILILGMGIPDSLKYLFFYHIGPQHFYMIVKKFLQEVNTGYLHVRSSDGKRVTRILPSEIIKKHVVTFWLREIMPNLGEEKNNLSALKKIIEHVDAKYKEVSQHAIREFESLPPEIKNSKPRIQIFREKMNTWMGAANIIVFKRFLKTAI